MLEPLELELRVVVSIVWVLGFRARFSVKSILWFAQPSLQVSELIINIFLKAGSHRVPLSGLKLTAQLIILKSKIKLNRKRRTPMFIFTRR